MPPSPSSPRGRPKDPDLCSRRCTEFLDAATRVFAEEGYRNADMQSIADRAGLSKGTIYLYFKNKEQLFLACVRHGVESLTESIEATFGEQDRFVDRLPLAIQAYLRFFDEHPELVELIIQERAEFRDRKQSTYFEHKATRSSRFADLIAADIEAGLVRDIPIPRIQDVIGDLLYGTIFANHFRGRIKSLEAQSQDIIDVLCHGLLRPGAV